MPFLRRNNQQTEDLFRGICPTVTPLSTATANGSAELPFSRLTWLFFSDIGDRYVLKDVVPSHTKLDRETLHGQTSTRSMWSEFMYNYTRARLTALMRASFAAPRILEPRKLILTATSNISRKFAPTKITRYTVSHTCMHNTHTHTHTHTLTTCVHVHTYSRAPPPPPTHTPPSTPHSP